MSGPSEAVLRAALLRIHRAATGESDAAYMSIPANPKEDADLILSAAIDELVELRKSVAVEVQRSTSKEEANDGATG